MSATPSLLSLLLAGTLIRTGLWFVYEPISHPDSATYFTAAAHIANGDFTGYEGRRTPGYPALIALAGLSPSKVWVLQMLCGLAISTLLFYIGLSATGQPQFAALIGMTYNLNLAQLFFEANLLSETTSTLTIVGVVAALAAVHRRLQARRPISPGLLMLGILGGVATLVRPQFLFLPVLLGALIAYASFALARSRVWAAVARACLVTAPGLLLVLGWASFNYARVGVFSLTTQLGVGLMAQSLPFIESAPDRYATIRDIYITHRDAKLAATGRQNAEWDAIPELLATTGLPFPALSKELERMSIGLFLRHPFRYGMGVAKAWVDFWLVPNYWRLDRLSSSSLASALRWTWRLEHSIIRLFNAMFLLLFVVGLCSRELRQRIGWQFTLSSIAILILAASIVPALSFWGENARYAIPVQSLVIVVVLIAGRGWLMARRGRSQGADTVRA